MTAITTDKHIRIVFDGFQRTGAALGFPAVSTLGGYLNSNVERSVKRGHTSFAIENEYARMFASAAVEMWQRAVHSFIISAGLSATSPLWSSVAGYYSTHYSVRAHAHLLGRYVLYRFPVFVTLGITGGSFYCALERKSGNDREHKVYRKFVHESHLFKADPFLNVESESNPQSDGAHRNKANYHDHIAGYSAFKALLQEDVVDRISRIAEIEISALPVPDSSKFPDLESVQLMAYHRIVRFRRFMDNLFGNDNRFWNAHRQPSWCANIIDFQFVEPELVLAQATT